MKFIFALCLIGCTLGVPQRGGIQERKRVRESVSGFPQRVRQEQGGKQLVSPQNDGDYIKLIRSDVSPIDGPNFKYSYETENGIKVEKEGRSGPDGQSVMSGFYSFPLEDGSLAEVRYTADENGYHPESPLIPVAPPMPAHALEQIRFAEEQRARGVEWDVRGFQI